MSMENNVNNSKESEKELHARMNRKKMKLPNTIGLSITLWLVFMIVFFVRNDIKPSKFYPLMGHMVTDTYLRDGSVVHYDNGDFGTIYKGEHADVYIDFSEMMYEMESSEAGVIKDAELYIPLYNAIVNVYLDGELIFKDEYDPDNLSAHYGSRIYHISLPDDYMSKKLMIDVTSVVSMPFSDLGSIGIVPSSESWKQIIQGNGLVFSTSLSLMILALISVFYFSIRSISLKKMQLGLPIAVFELFINAWFFGSLRMFYLIIGNENLCAKMEYYALYIAPIPLAFFIYSVLDIPVFKKLVKGITGIYVIYYLVTTFIELSNIQKNYSEMLTSMHLFAGITILTLVIALFAGTRNQSNYYIFILRYGVLIAMLCGIIELIRFNITKYVLQRSWFTTHGLSALAILVIAVSLVIYLISVSAEEYTAKVEQKQLMALAYKDSLTNMPNRASCYKSIEDMEAEGIKEYTMVFIDLNNLKTANDVHGHDTGDRLLKMTAGHIMDIFSEDGFCARWGGDEFVACVFGDENRAKERVWEFLARMDVEDASGSFPFKVSAACGQVRSDKKKYLDPLEAIRQADAIMYENKKRMKAGR